MITPRKYTLDEAAEILRLPQDKVAEHCGPAEWTDQGYRLPRELIEKIAAVEGVNL